MKPVGQVALAFALALFSSAIIGACTNNQGEPCSPGDYRYCDCPGKPAPGYSECSADGQEYGSCDCSGVIPGTVDAAADAPVDTGPELTVSDGGLLPFMAACDTNAQCTTGLCFYFNAKGPRCSKPCKQSTDCPPPATGCNGMGICKAP